jgi:iron uptake system EfeUOB component EfeO/EfeM
MTDYGRAISFVNRRADKLMTDVEHLQEQCDSLLGRVLINRAAVSAFG